MPKFEFEDSQEQTFTEIDSPERQEIKDLLAHIENSHHLRYKLMNLESWALAETMDQFIPGFWSRFLANRRTAMKQFLEQRRKCETHAAESGLSSVDTPRSKETGIL